MKEKSIHIGSLGDLVIRVPDERAHQLKETWQYRTFMRPVLDRFAGSGHASPAAVPEAWPLAAPRPISLPKDTPEQRAIVENVEGRTWYHTIDLGHGIRTPGEFDHTPILSSMSLPTSLTGKRCLDVATLDGFWALEMEKRGAEEVVALDIDSWLDLDVPQYVRDGFVTKGIDFPTGEGFKYVNGLLGSKVDRRICNLYNLGPDAFGKFDFVFVGDILVHLSNPNWALQRILSVTNGEALFMEPFLPQMDVPGLGPLAWLHGELDSSRWWNFSLSFLEKAILLAGFSHVELVGVVDVRHRSLPDLEAPRALLRAIP